MVNVTASDIVRAIARLPRNRDYHYINPVNTGRIVIDEVILPEGPVVIKRYDPNKRQKREDAGRSSISSQLIWRVANAFSEGVPVNIDRILGASYNTRS